EVTRVLWRDTLTTSSNCVPLDITVSGTPSDSSTVAGSGYDMVSPHMRLTRFWISAVPPVINNIYNVDVWMTCGDTDLQNVDGTGRASCNGTNGEEYCAISNLSQSVARRIN